MNLNLLRNTLDRTLTHALQKSEKRVRRERGEKKGEGEKAEKGDRGEKEAAAAAPTWGAKKSFADIIKKAER